MRGLSFLSIVCFYILTALACAYLLWDIRATRIGKKRWPKIIIGVFEILLFALISEIAVCDVKDSSTSLLRPMWLIYTYFSVFIPLLFYIICSAIGRFVRFVFRKRGGVNYGSWIGIVVALVAFVLIWVGAIQTRHEIKVNRVEIESGRLPESFIGYRIVQFSDAHVGTWGNDVKFVNQMVDSINSLKPDLILFTGDLVNRETTEMEPFLSSLSRLRAKDGVYSVLGNHDYGDYNNWSNSYDRDANNALMAIWQKQIGWHLLNNSRKLITNGNDTIVLIGVENWGEPPFKQYGKLTDAYPLWPDSIYNLNDSRFKILMSHNPEHWNREVTEISNIDLTLSGHTHAMQTMFSMFGRDLSPAAFRYPQWGGLYERTNSVGDTARLYVNIGVGEVGIPARFGTAYPEITLITLKR